MGCCWTPSRKEKYGDALNKIQSSIEGRAEFRNAQQYISECFSIGCELFSFNNYANSLVIALKTGDKQIINRVIEDIRSIFGGIL